MKTKITQLTLLFATLGLFASAQDYSSFKKGSLIGFGFNAVDFYTPDNIKSGSLKSVLKNNGWTKFRDHDFGLSLMYWKGLTRRVDLSARYNGLFSDYGKTSSSQGGYINELETSLHARAFTDDHLLNPFLTAGIGAGNYGKKIGAYTPVGAGLQVNLSSISYIFLQANYRHSLSRSVLSNNLFYSFGITENLSSGKKTRPIKELPLPVVINYDRDNDGVPDSTDACKDVAGLVALQGCPDADNDGVADKDDKCPKIAGVKKYDGCPVPDSDNDGINDEQDKCPGEAGVAKYGGCPVPDSDKDGVNDEQDKCPDVAGTALNAGCPEIKKEVIEKVNYAAKKILFSTGSSKLLSKSLRPLNEVVLLLQANPTWKLNIDGYTDNTGNADKNMALSQARANAVRDYLTKKGIDGSRLIAEGHGQENPIGDNATPAGRAKNRRVEMTLKSY